MIEAWTIAGQATGAGLLVSRDGGIQRLFEATGSCIPRGIAYNGRATKQENTPSKSDHPLAEVFGHRKTGVCAVEPSSGESLQAMIAVQQEMFETNRPVAERKPVNVASVPQRSPFRYPGGKTWFVPWLRKWLGQKASKPKLLIDPFAGGGIVSLTAAFEDLAESVLMVEIDDEVASVWKTIVLGEGQWLAEQILSFSMTRESAAAEIGREVATLREKAFQTMLKNRTLHGGILAAGSRFMKNGEAGKGISSRWYPATLAKRIRNIALVLEKVTFIHGNAFDTLDAYREDQDAVFFLDPPYTAGGKKAGCRLYTHSHLDHDRLFRSCVELHGDFIMTYDNAPEVLDLAKRYSLQSVPIVMKNTHHMERTELVVGKDLSWMDEYRAGNHDS